LKIKIGIKIIFLRKKIFDGRKKILGIGKKNLKKNLLEKKFLADLF